MAKNTAKNKGLGRGLDAIFQDNFYQEEEPAGSALMTVSIGEIEAARTLGMNKRKTFFHVIFPQALTTALPLFKNQFISTLQETSIVGYLAIMDLTRASSIITSRTLDAFFGLICVSIMYLVIGYAGRSLLGLLGKRKHIGG